MNETTLRPAVLGTDGYRMTFETAPIAIWREDFSRVVELSDALRARGLTDIRSALAANDALLTEAIGSVVVRDVNAQAVHIAGASTRDDLLGPIPAQMLTAGARAALIEQVVAVSEGADRLTLMLDGADYAGDRASYELRWVAPRGPDGVVDYANVVVVILDVTDRKRAEVLADRHLRQLASLIDVGRRMAASLDVEVILQTITDAAIGIAESDRTLLAMFADEGCGEGRVAGSGFGSAHELDAFRVMASGVGAWAAERHETTRTADLAADPRTLEPGRIAAGGYQGTTALVAPIVCDQVAKGILAAFRGPDRPAFSDQDVSALAMLAEQAAVAIRNAHLYDQVRAARDSLETTIEELRATQSKLLQAQKLEAIGALAAGVAHEINTPIQYVADNTNFLKEVLEAHGEVAAAAEAIADAIRSGSDVDGALDAYERMCEEKDFSFLVEEAPLAIDQSLEGISRVAEIVLAMKEFAHPGSNEKVALDVNRAIRTTIEVSRNEWKYVADVELDLDESLPMVPALAGPLNQSFLVMVVNAAQAIAEVTGDGSGGKGRISVTSRLAGDHVEIRFADTGPGVPEDVLPRIFDPFFTTKEVGTGSGQGLSIAWSVIIEQHGGELVYDDSGPGATFVIRLPVADGGGQA